MVPWFVEPKQHLISTSVDRLVGMSLVHFLETIASVDIVYFFAFRSFFGFVQELEQEPEFEALQGSSAPLELDFKL